MSIDVVGEFSAQGSANIGVSGNRNFNVAGVHQSGRFVTLSGPAQLLGDASSQNLILRITSGTIDGRPSPGPIEVVSMPVPRLSNVPCDLGR